MPNADFFTRFGLFVYKGFFDPALCLRIRSEMQTTPSTPATVVEKEGPDNAVDEKTRSTKSAKVSTQTRSLVEERLLALVPMLGGHFNVQLNGCQKPGFLVYKEGDFFRRHPDNSTDPEAPAFLKERQISAVVFLNSEAEDSEPDSYSGGSLTFYRLMDEPRQRNIGFPLTGEEGLLVAFRSNILHEVTPVTRGERYTIVSWFR